MYVKKKKLKEKIKRKKLLKNNKYIKKKISK